MAYVESTVTINGLPGQLTRFGTYVASIRLPQDDHQFYSGEPLRLTVFMKLMDKLVPVTLQGEVVQPQSDSIEVMYVAPTENWSRMLDSPNRHDALLPHTHN